jgi:hypothetical protein
MSSIPDAVDYQKDVRHVTLAMTSKDIEQYSTTGWIREDGRTVCKQPAGIDIVWYARSNPNSPTISATFFTSHLNPNPLCRKTGEDIDNELSTLPVVSDRISSIPSDRIITHPYLKVETLLQNPEFDYNKGELDFLRSRPVRARTEWKTKEEVDRINAELIRQQKLLGEEKEMMLKLDEASMEKNEETGIKYYPFTTVQVTKGGDQEHHGARDPTSSGATDTSFAVPLHEQEISNANRTAKRMYDGAKKHLMKSIGISTVKNVERIDW